MNGNGAGLVQEGGPATLSYPSMFGMMGPGFGPGAAYRWAMMGEQPGARRGASFPPPFPGPPGPWWWWHSMHGGPDPGGAGSAHPQGIRAQSKNGASHGNGGNAWKGTFTRQELVSALAQQAHQNGPGESGGTSTRGSPHSWFGPNGAGAAKSLWWSNMPWANNGQQQQQQQRSAFWPTPPPPSSPMAMPFFGPNGGNGNGGQSSPTTPAMPFPAGGPSVPMPLLCFPLGGAPFPEAEQPVNILPIPEGEQPVNILPYPFPLPGMSPPNNNGGDNGAAAGSNGNGSNGPSA